MKTAASLCIVRICHYTIHFQSVRRDKSNRIFATCVDYVVSVPQLPPRCSSSMLAVLATILNSVSQYKMVMARICTGLSVATQYSDSVLV